MMTKYSVRLAQFVRKGVTGILDGLFNSEITKIIGGFIDMANFDVAALREKVMSSDDVQTGEVYVQEWDVTLPIKTLSPSDLKKVTKYSEDPIRLAIIAVIHGCKTPQGESVFTEKDLAKFESEKSFGAIQTVAEAVLEISGYSDKAVDEAKND